MMFQALPMSVMNAFGSEGRGKIIPSSIPIPVTTTNTMPGASSRRPESFTMPVTNSVSAV